jgi:hypothetical protein
LNGSAIVEAAIRTGAQVSIQTLRFGFWEISERYVNFT